MKIYIPTIGTKIKLIKPWEFMLYEERRNNDFIHKYFGIEKKYEWSWIAPEGYKDQNVIFPTRTELTVDRIYVRKGLHNFDSLSFHTKVPGLFGITKGRFWAKLEDVNRMEFELI